MLTDESLKIVVQRGDAVQLAQEVLRLRRRLQNTEGRRYDGRLRRACLAALREPGTVAEVASRLGWSYARARRWVHYLLRTGSIMRVDTVRSASGQHAGRYQIVTS